MQICKNAISTNYDLFLDTTNNFCYVAIYTKNKKICDLKLPVNKNVTDIITDTIKSFFKKTKIHYKDIKNFYLNIGPGSFTGIKVGVTIAKVWLCLYKINLFVINSLQLQTNKEQCISLLDAKGNMFYTAIYDNNNVILKPCLKTQKQVQFLIKKYKKYHQCINQLDNAYNLFLYHKSHFKKISINSLKPLYLKTPFKKHK